MFAIIGLEYHMVLLIAFFVIGIVAVALLLWWPYNGPALDVRAPASVPDFVQYVTKLTSGALVPDEQVLIGRKRLDALSEVEVGRQFCRQP